MSIIKQFIDSQGACDEYDACRSVIRKHFPELEENGDEVDPVALISSKKIEIDRRDDIPYEGMIERDGQGQARVTLRRSLNRRRLRFTAAHELGHWLIQEELCGSMEGQLFRGVSATSSEVAEEETLANLFAAEILMPCGGFRKTYEQSYGVSPLSTLCRKYAVSRTAAIRRLAEVCEKHFVMLQIIPYMLRDEGTAAEIDDAVYATSKGPALFDRNRTELKIRVPFSILRDSGEVDLDINSPKGLISSSFTIESRKEPIPTIFALTQLDEWPNDKCSMRLVS